VRRRSALHYRVSGPVFALLLAVAWGTGVAGEERPVPWELRVSALGQPAARAGGARDDRERDRHRVRRTGSGLELRIEQSDNDGDLVVRNDGDETIVVQLLHATKLIQQVPLESDETLYFHPE
jgi:hypothetical protein